MKPKPHRGRRRTSHKGRNNEGATLGGQHGAGRGTPRYMNRPKATAADHSSASESEARRVGAQGGQVQEAPVATPLGRAAADAMQASDAPSQSLSSSHRDYAEAKLGADFSDVGVTYNSGIAAAFGANAITFGNQIHVSAGSADDTLMTHELAHVQQQRKFGAHTAQFDIATRSSDEGDTGLGQFVVDFKPKTDPAKPKTGEDGSIEFHPYAASPYSNRIGLIQVVDTEEIKTDGSTEDFDWSGTSEKNREEVKNSEGAFVDMLHGSVGGNRNAEPWYWGDGIGNPDLTTARDHYGWNRSDSDISEAALGDFPGASAPIRFKFETVAMGRDNQTVYGAVRWGFDLTPDSSSTTGVKVAAEWIEVPKINASGTGEKLQSDNFDSAVAEFEDFYAKQPDIIYFESNSAVISDSDRAKYADAASYMSAHPDMQITLTASTDQNGSVAYNRRLAAQRLDAVKAELIALGVPEDRILSNYAESGETTAHAINSPDQSDPGSLQANRRVEIKYERPFSAP